MSAAINATGLTNPPPQRVLQHGRNGNVTYTIGNLIPGATYTRPEGRDRLRA